MCATPAGRALVNGAPGSGQLIATLGHAGKLDSQSFQQVGGAPKVVERLGRADRIVERTTRGETLRQILAILEEKWRLGGLLDGDGGAVGFRRVAVIVEHLQGHPEM